MLDTTQTDQPNDTVPQQVNSQDYSYNNASQDREDSQGSFNDPEDPSVSKDRDEKNAITSVLNEINQLDRESVKSVTIHMEYDKQEQDTKIDVSTEGEETESSHESSWDSNDEEDAEGMSYGNMVMYIAIAIIIIGTLVVIILGCNNSNGDEDLGNRNKIELEKNDLVELSQKNEELHKKTKKFKHEARSESKILSKEQESQDINTENEERRGETEEKSVKQDDTNIVDNENREEKEDGEHEENPGKDDKNEEDGEHEEKQKEKEIEKVENYIKKNPESALNDIVENVKVVHISEDEIKKIFDEIRVKEENKAKEKDNSHTTNSNSDEVIDNKNQTDPNAKDKANEGCCKKNWKKIIENLNTPKGKCKLWFIVFSFWTLVVALVEFIHFVYNATVHPKTPPTFYVTNWTFGAHIILGCVTIFVFCYYYAKLGERLYCVQLVHMITLALFSICIYVVRGVYWAKQRWTFMGDNDYLVGEVLLLVFGGLFIFTKSLNFFYLCGCFKNCNICLHKI